MTSGTRQPALSGLSLRDLAYAVAVGETRHFGRAADRCAVSQSALSEQIRKLEEVLGVTLFERTNRRVAPTAKGLALLAQAERVLAEARVLVEMAGSLSAPLTGPLHLGVIATLAPYYMPHLLRPARDAFPALALRVAEGFTEDLAAQLRRGTQDAVLLALPAPEGLSVEPLFFEPFRLVCPAAHPLAALADPCLEDLDREDLILLEDGHCLRDQALSLCGRGRRRAREATSVEMLWHMIAAGEGYSLLPALAVRDRAGLNDMVRCTALDDDAGRTIGLAWRPTDPRAPEFRQLAAFMRASLPPGVMPVP